MFHEALDFLLKLPVFFFLNLALLVHGHVLHPVRHGDRQGVEPVVMDETALLSGDVCELPEQLVLMGSLTGQVLCRVVVGLDHLGINDEAMLVQDGFQRVDDPLLLLH